MAFRWVDGGGNFINNTGVAGGYTLFQTAPTGTTYYSTTGGVVAWLAGMEIHWLYVSPVLYHEPVPGRS